MLLPTLRNIARQRTTVKTFGGYCHTIDCAESAFYDAQNLSSRNYPALSPRLPRTQIATLTKPNGLYAKNGLIWVDGTALYYNGSRVGTVADSKKQFCGIGSRVIIWPDKLSLDTQTQTLTSLGAVWESVGTVQFNLCLEDGEAITVSNTGDTAPEDAENGDFWLDTGGISDVLRVYAKASETWSAVPTTFLKIAAEGIGAAFAKHDSVTISGVCNETMEGLDSVNGQSVILWDVAEDYLVVTGLLSAVANQTVEQGKIKVERVIPDMDFITQNENRVWGCSSAKHEIYACKLGDPTNWASYMGTAADSYAVSVGSDGAFTAATTAMGYLLFMKEQLIHKVYGTKPSNYQITTIACRGVQKGCADSLATVQETLYYKAPDGVMQYDGGLPYDISESLGQVQYVGAVAGAVGEHYYIAMCAENGAQHFFCYDATHRIWHREEDAGVVQFASTGQCLYFLRDDGTLWAIGTSDTVGQTQEPQTEGAIKWYAETGDIGLYTSELQTVSKIEVRLEAAEDMMMTISAQYDSIGIWEPLANVRARRKEMRTISIVPRRFDHMKLRYEGCGDMTLYMVTKLLEKGSELTWRT